MMLNHAAIIGCQFKAMFPGEQVPVVCCDPEVVGNSLLTVSRGAPCSSFHTWTLQYLRQFLKFRDGQGTLAGTAERNVNRENRAGARARIQLLPGSISTAQR